MKKKIPENFIFGASVSSYQTEGDNFYSDWYDWEISNINISETCGMACDSWNKFNEDIQLLKELGLKYYRLSIEWSRISPTPGKINTSALNHYEKILTTLKENDINIFLTLQHHTLPDWLDHGWTNPNIEKYFEQYVSVIAKNFHYLVDAWMPINEPGVNCTFGYFFNEFPPGQKSSLGYIHASRHQARCHYAAYNKLKEINPDIPVGFVKQLIIFRTLKKTIINNFLLSYYDYVFNKIYLNIFRKGNLPFSIRTIPDIENSIDFWGLNYYTHKWVSSKFEGNQTFNFDPSVEITQTGWEVHPEGLLEACRVLWNIKKVPIYITENGIATDNENQRKKFIYEHLKSALAAIEENIDVRGYFYWSLMDNFEWCMGYKPKFGLASIEKNTLSRIPKESGYYLGRIAKNKE
ncbi:MAG: family 1 glycosylhydrolase, partial [Victivallales bacterium]|nr:family 1 glycosylhydrolase [Victivallales bacterium]